MHRVLLPLIVLVGISCQPSAVEFRATTTGPDVEAIMLWFEQYTAAVNSGDLEAWANFIADDAVVMPPDELPISGMDQLRPLYETVFGTYTFDFNARVEETVVAGDLAVLRAFLRGDRDAEGRRRTERIQWFLARGPEAAVRRFLEDVAQHVGGDISAIHERLRMIDRLAPTRPLVNLPHASARWQRSPTRVCGRRRPEAGSSRRG